MRPAFLLPALFVCLWSTGFLGAKLGLPHAEPLTFLALRFGIVAAVLAAWTFAASAPWPSPRQVGYQVLIGVLVHGLYLGGVFVAISWGIEAGTSALIVGLQPVATALLAVSFLGERLSRLQWLGMALGLAGSALVIARKLQAGLGDPAGVAVCVLGLFAIAFGTILQKRQAEHVPMRAGNAIQFAAAALVCMLGALIWETREIAWTVEFTFALVWLVGVLSLGAITMFYMMIKRGAAAEVASLFFLVPPCTALFAWALFGERLGPLEILGLSVAMIGVLLVNRTVGGSAR